ncbi:MAG: hypothetical protein SCK70_12420, partial [bacterium]|nr:hypothetical protein [bacterium]
VLLCQQDMFYCGDCADCKRVSKLSHPDVTVIFPAPKEPKVEDIKTIRESIVRNPYFRTQLWIKPEILIDTIRSLKKTVSMKSFENKGRVIILLDAHLLRTEAGNSLLKLLEEPPAKVTLLLVTPKPNLLLSTIESRCQRVRFDPLCWEEIQAGLIQRDSVDAERANVIARISFGSYRRALEFLDDDISQKQELLLEILRKLIASDLDILLLVEKLVDRQDGKSIKELLELMGVWFRDAMIYHTLGNSDSTQQKLINIEQIETLGKFVGAFETIDHERVLAEIEKTITMIDRNVNMNLALLQLLFALKRLLRRKQNV